MPLDAESQQATRHAIRAALRAAEVATTPRDDHDAVRIMPTAYVLGLDLCRRGQWHGGLYQLCQLDLGDARTLLPGTFFSYLGHAYARCEHRYREGLELCERAVEMEFYEPENWLNLAWTCVLARQRRRACEAVLRGLSIDPHHQGLLDLYSRLGVRREPVIRFLDRSHPLNVMLGRWRSSMLMRHAANSAA